MALFGNTPRLWSGKVYAAIRHTAPVRRLQFKQEPQHIVKMSGWNDLVAVLKEAAQAEGARVSWKEKYGRLSITLYGGDALWRLSEALEDLSGFVCQFCGRPGYPRPDLRGGWVRTLCDPHADEINAGRWWLDVAKEAEDDGISALTSEERTMLLGLTHGQSLGAAEVLRSRLVNLYGLGPYQEHTLPASLARHCEILEAPTPLI